MRKLLLTTIALAVCPLGMALAQTTVHDALVKHWKTTGEFTIAVAKAMPADSYNFRPNPEEMSFGHVMSHIAMANLGACANASGLPRPAVDDKLTALLRDEKSDVDRDTTLRFLTTSFDFCNRAVDSMTPAKLDASVGPANRKMTGFEWLWSYFTHTAHHRGQAEVYLRVKGIKPPDYTF